MADAEEIFNYVESPDKKILKYLSATPNPTTVIYKKAKNLAKNLINEDGTIAIRIVKDDFCKTLIQNSKKPIVSTSANVSGELFPKNFTQISREIINGVDFIVQHRQGDSVFFQPSSIIKLNDQGEIETLRP